MITRLQYVILCRLAKGKRAFAHMATAHTPESVMMRRREGLEDLYRRRLIKRGAHGPMLTIAGREILQTIEKPNRTWKGNPRRTDIIQTQAEFMGENPARLSRRLQRLRREISEGRNFEADMWRLERAPTGMIGRG